MTCPVLSAFTAVDRIGTELDRLSDELPELFSSGFKVTLDDQYVEATLNGWSTATWTVYYDVQGVIPRQRMPGQLVLHFDLTRDEDPTSGWEHRDQALLVVAYEPRKTNGWSGTQLLVRADGRFSDESCRANLVAAADGRVAYWNAAHAGLPWSRRAWVFAVPLVRIDGAQALVDEIARPVETLFKGSDLDPASAFSGTSVIRWT